MTVVSDVTGRSRLLPVQRAGIILLGLALAAAMGVLGVWQAQVYQSQGLEAAAHRAAEPARPLTEVAPVGATVTDGYGRTVTFTGHYRPDLQLVVRSSDDPEVRVLTGFELTDGSLVAVVRGSLPAGTAEPPAPPSGTLTQSGLLLPSEDSGENDPDAPGVITAIRVQRLAQQWPGSLVNGYVTLTSADAAGQGLAASPYRLPDAPGRLRNGAYAVQWWVFAAFAIGMAIKVARDLGRPRPDGDKNYDVES
ncbi:SURF1 family protein [Microlunatus parietis]|uniref:SURF1-like protein n=1 Tax=Microlunatus parietis TaxID=682979 RepID=A0A7Y9LCV1_9ACTN|nr:SURF1 family protein [Microlunatus parietis]NYE72223.1 cytochrome oxidase assembly protein ShyY1 [Microlunatus parietis]